MDEDLRGDSPELSADRLVAHLWALIRARGIDRLGVDRVIDAVAIALEEAGATFVRDLPLTGFDVPDERIDLLVAPGIAVLLDVGESAPSLERLRRCASPVGVRAVAVLTDRSPDLYPAEHSQRRLVHGKSLCVHRIGRGRA